VIGSNKCVRKIIARSDWDLDGGISYIGSEIDWKFWEERIACDLTDSLSQSLNLKSPSACLSYHIVIGFSSSIIVFLWLPLLLFLVAGRQIRWMRKWISPLRLLFLGNDRRLSTSIPVFVF
jgi:hypothetical protein